MRLALATGALAVAALAACDGTDGARRFRIAERDQLRREVAGYRALEPDSLTRLVDPTHDVVVSVSDSLLRTLVDATLPIPVDVAGNATIRLLAARVAFRGNVARVDVAGEVRPTRFPSVAAVVTLRGAIDRFVVDSARVLRAHVSLDDADVAAPTGVPRAAAPYVRTLLQGIVERAVPELTDALPTIAIPVRLERAVRLPGFGPSGLLSVAAAEAPLTVRAERVLALRSRLWIVLHLERGPFVRVAGDRR